MTDTRPRLIGAGAAEKLLGVSRATVSRMARDGRLSPVYVTPVYLFDLAEVEQLAQQRQEIAS